MRKILDAFIALILWSIPLALFLIFGYGLVCLIVLPVCAAEKLATISRNPFIGDSTSNPFSMYNNPFNPNSPRNSFGPYGNRFSNYSANNPFATKSPGIYGYADEPSVTEGDSYPYDNVDGDIE